MNYFDANIKVVWCRTHVSTIACFLRQNLTEMFSISFSATKMHNKTTYCYSNKLSESCRTTSMNKSEHWWKSPTWTEKKSHLFPLKFCETDELERSGPSHSTALFLTSPEGRGLAENWETGHLCLRGKGLQKTESGQNDSPVSTATSNQSDACD